MVCDANAMLFTCARHWDDCYVALDVCESPREHIGLRGRHNLLCIDWLGEEYNRMVVSLRLYGVPKLWVLLVGQVVLESILEAFRRGLVPAPVIQYTYVSVHNGK